MQIVMYRWFFVVLGLMQTGQCEGQICEGDTVNTVFSFQSADSNCTTYEWKFRATVASDLYFQLKPSIISEGDYCEVHEGTNVSGKLFGRIDKYQIGPVLYNTSQIFVSCVLENTGYVILQANQYFPNRCERSSIESLPSRTTSKDHPMHYSANTVCIWDYTGPQRRKFVFDFSAFNYEEDLDFLYIIPDDNDSPRLKTTDRRDRFQFVTEGKSFRIVTTSDPANQQEGFVVNISEEPPEHSDVSCQEEIKINLGTNDLANITYENADVLYISTTRQNDLNNVPNACKAGGDSPSFNFNLTQCEATYIEDGSSLNIQFTIWNFKAMDISHSIQRYVSYSLAITCDFNDSYALHSAVINPQIQEIGQGSDPVSGKFEISLNLYNDSGFNTALVENSQVIVPDCIFAKVTLDDIPSQNDDYIVQLDDCWATQSESPNAAPSYLIIDGGCKAPPSGSESSDAKEILRNYEARYAAFKFKTFVWTNFTDSEQSIFVHCNISVCQNSTGFCPGKVCVTRKRRVPGEGDSQRLTIGPIHLAKTERYDSDGVQVKETLEENVNFVYVTAFARNAFMAMLLVLFIYVVAAIVTKKKFKFELFEV